MSSGHHAKHDLSPAELDDLLDEALANPKIKKRLARHFNLITDSDIALLGSSSIGGINVYLDRHLSYKKWPYGILPVQSRKLDVKPELIRHERLEQALEDELGWPYMPLAHPVAQHWEERGYRAKGFDPREVERMFRPFIKHDEAERIIKSPTDLDMRPLLAPPRSTAIIEKINETAQKEKRAHEKIGYKDKSALIGQRCDKCRHFIEPKYGGPACIGVDSPIAPGGWCRRFAAGKLRRFAECLTPTTKLATLPVAIRSSKTTTGQP